MEEKRKKGPYDEFMDFEDAIPDEELSFEEDFTKTIMDYLMFKENLDVKSFNEALVKKVLYNSIIGSTHDKVFISLRRKGGSEDE